MERGKETMADGGIREFLFEDRCTRKFWEIATRGCTVMTAWGRVGTPGQSNRRTCSSEEAADAFSAKTIAAKRKKGYVEKAGARLLQVPADVRKEAKKMSFVETPGGPILVVPKDVARQWNGTYDADGQYIFETRPCDYDRACVDDGSWVRTVQVGTGKGLVLVSTDPAAWHPLHKGGIFLRWGACDSTAALLTQALSVPETDWRRTRLRFPVGGGGDLVMFFAGNSGADPGDEKTQQHLDYRYGQVSTFRVTPGDYAVDIVPSLNGTVMDNDQRATIETQLIRLRAVS